VPEHTKRVAWRTRNARGEILAPQANCDVLLRMKLPFLLALLAPILLQAADDDGFVSLFDGKSLAGWVNINCAPETWTVRNGMLHCDGVPTGALRTEKQFENFILELEWRHLKPGGNAGVFIWASPLTAVGQPFLRSIEVQVLENAFGNTESHTTHGDVFSIHGSTMKPFPPSRGERSFPTEHRSKPSPEWNHYRITCQGGTLRLAVNGKEVSGGEECVWRKGYLALESEGGEVDWRNLRIKELPPSGATPEQTAPVAEPWVSLYDGRSLRGWREAAGWKSADWQLRGEAGAATLWSERSLGDFDLQLDWSRDAAAGPASPVVFRAGDASEIALPALPTIREKGWNRLAITRRGTKLTMTLNDEREKTRAVRELSVPAGPLTPGLQAGDAAIRCAGLFVK
jgi:3-keto-disaccharide hydrolase